MMYGSWDIEHDRQRLFVILDYFLTFYIPNNLENQNLKKNEKNPGYIIIVPLCITSEDHIMYGSWDMEHNRQNFFSYFRPFTLKIKILKKWK